MGLTIKRAESPLPSSSLIEIIQNLFIKNLLVGKSEPSYPFQTCGEKILYFRNKDCVTCGKIDMNLMRYCKAHSLKVVIVDRWPSEGIPESMISYIQETGNIMDSSGDINKAFKVAIYPTIIYIDKNNQIANRKVGFNENEIESFEKTMEKFTRSI